MTFAALWLLSRGVPELFRTGWFLESLLTELAIVFVVRTRHPAHRSPPGTLLWTSTLAVAAVSLAIPWLPGSDWFGFVPLPGAVLATVLGITLAYAGASELAKRHFLIP
jgi:Mg2+-importing ATPase